MKALCKYIASFVKLFKMTFVLKLPQVEIYYLHEYIEYGSHFLITNKEYQLLLELECF